jgi:type VI secretion system protein ImpJ
VAEVSDYLLLQTLNRYEPLLQHLRRVPTTSPEALYATLLSMAGELSTYVRPETRRPLDSHPAYQHIEPQSCLKPIVDDTHWLLNAVLVRSAQSIPLKDEGHGLRRASVDPVELRSFSAVVLAVAAQLPADALVQQFSTQAKVGPTEGLTDLVRSHLPGVVLQSLPVPPRQIPFNAGYVYFELARSGALWDAIVMQGGIGLHVAGDFPGLKLELWGVR